MNIDNKVGWLKMNKINLINLSSAILTEKCLSKDWQTIEEDEAWKNL